MKMYHWGFDKAGYSHPELADEFLLRNRFLEVYKGYSTTKKTPSSGLSIPEEEGFVYLNPENVVFVTYLPFWRDGYWHYVGISSFNKVPLNRVVNDLKNNPVKMGDVSYLFFYEDESPNERGFI